MHPYRHAASMIAAASALLLAASACGPLNREPAGEDDWRTVGLRNIEKIAASERNYDIYWLGRGFTAGEIEYWGPDVADPDSPTADIGKVEGGGIGLHYLASGTTCCGSLTLVMYSRPAWERVQELRARGAQPRFKSSNVEIDGRRAELRTHLGTLNPISAQILIIEFGDTVVEATTGAVVLPTPDAAQPNPLIDETKFLAVMQNLRPYPE